MKRWGILMVAVVLCWAAAMGCSGGGGPSGGGEAPPPPPGPPEPGPSKAMSRSLFIPVVTSGDVQVYRTDIEPAVKPEVTDPSKKTVVPPKMQGYKMKTAITGHHKHDVKARPIGVSPYHELIASCIPVMGVVDIKTGSLCKDYQARLVHKGGTVDILKNRILGGSVYILSYDTAGDRLLFLVQDGGGARLLQRGMDGKESELYQDKSLSAYLYMGVIALTGDKGVALLDLNTGKITKVSDSGQLMSVLGRNHDYVLMQKDGKYQLVKSDGSKAFDLPGLSAARFLNTEKNEYIFYFSSSQKDPTSGKLVSTKTIQRLDLLSGKLTTLFGGKLDWVIDHVGDQYLVGALKYDEATQYSIQLAWLKPDGSLQDIVSIPTVSSAFITSYNPANQVVLINDGMENLVLVSAKDGKVAATLAKTQARLTDVFPEASLWPVVLTFQAGATPGAFKVGMLSPDTLGGDNGITMSPVELGTIDTKDAKSVVASGMMSIPIYDAKDRPSSVVADTTPPPACVPQCMGLQCGDDGCGGVCGTCADGKSCNAGICMEQAKQPPIISAINFAGSIPMFNAGSSSFASINGDRPLFKITSNDGIFSVTVSCTDKNGTPPKAVAIYLSADTADTQDYEMPVAYPENPNLKQGATEICTIKAIDTLGASTSIDVTLQW